ncbi:hypothetical protein IWW38_006493, partial [Coemansia aciculifera]
MVERHIAREVESYSKGGFPRQSERYYYLMSALHVTRMMFHDGNCQPFHREFYRRLAQIHHSQQEAKTGSAAAPEVSSSPPTSNAAAQPPVGGSDTTL